MKCLDTYALVEISDGNPKFLPYLEQEVAIPETTMAEFYADLYKKWGLKTADYWVRVLKPLCVPISMTIFCEAVKYKVDHRKEGLSFFDCVGYAFALRNNFLFVTGDKAFQNKDGVEFLQK